MLRSLVAALLTTVCPFGRQVCKQLTAMFQTERTYETPNRVDYLRYAMGVNQHHDAVTGQ